MTADKASVRMDGETRLVNAAYKRSIRMQNESRAAPVGATQWITVQQLLPHTEYTGLPQYYRFAPAVWLYYGGMTPVIMYTLHCTTSSVVLSTHLVHSSWSSLSLNWSWSRIVFNVIQTPRILKTMLRPEVCQAWIWLPGLVRVKSVAMQI
jgi:hypothetical protein